MPLCDRSCQFCPVTELESKPNQSTANSKKNPLSRIIQSKFLKNSYLNFFILPTVPVKNQRKTEKEWRNNLMNVFSRVYLFAWAIISLSSSVLSKSKLMIHKCSFVFSEYVISISRHVCLFLNILSTYMRICYAFVLIYELRWSNDIHSWWWVKRTFLVTMLARIFFCSFFEFTSCKGKFLF